jgi:hypothetical protein
MVFPWFGISPLITCREKRAAYGLLLDYVIAYQLVSHRNAIRVSRVGQLIRERSVNQLYRFSVIDPLEQEHRDTTKDYHNRGNCRNRA